MLSSLKGLQRMTVILIGSPPYLPHRLSAINDNDTSVWEIRARISADILILIMSHSYCNLLPQRDNKVNYHIPYPLFLLHLEHQLHALPTVNGMILQELLTRIVPVIHVQDIHLVIPTMINVLASLADIKFFLVLPLQTTPFVKSIPVFAVL